ncbi:MAG TPA: amidohydrolase family protein, partial [Anaerolineales bacterium]
FLGAHAVPEESTGPDEYVDQLVSRILPAVRGWWQENAAGAALPFVDAFCEAGAFDLGQTRRILARAGELGFPLKIHAEEFSRLGGARLAVELGATSADHLNRISEEDVEAMGRSQTVAVLLPATPFGLGEAIYPPARNLIEANALIALGSDLNPGTAWCENLQFVIALACRTLRLTPAQALAAATINAAAAIGRQDSVGSLEAGKQADFVILDAADFRHLAYRFGGNLAAAVYRRGRRI